MAYDSIVIGAGLSGLYAGALAARSGKKVLILARGVGSTHIGAGTIDVYNDLVALKASYKSKSHPYAIIGTQALNSAIENFKTICAEHSYPLHGEVGKNFKLPTAIGGTRSACLIPETMLAGDLSRKEKFAIANIQNFRDFSAALTSTNLKSSIIDLHLPATPFHRDSYATDLAHSLDKPTYREEVIKLWKPWLKESPKRIGIPAILGLDHSLEAKKHLETELGIELFEIPILPPSLPGIRLFNLLRDDFQNHGGRFILGPTVTGKIESGRVVSVTADMNSHKKEYQAEKVILATGGFLNGGLRSEMNGAVHESVFDLPTFNLPSRAAWTNESFLTSHPYAKFGMMVDKSFRPLNHDGKVMADNLVAIGSALSGADRVNEGSREGIELGSAWKVVCE